MSARPRAAMLPLLAALAGSLVLAASPGQNSLIWGIGLEDVAIIVPKSSYALGFARATENVTITNSQVSGYDVTDVHLEHVRGRLAPGVPFALLRDVRGLSGHDSPGLPAARREQVEKGELNP